MAAPAPASGSSTESSTKSGNMADYRFVLRPRWLLLHLVAVAALAGMVTAGFWQVDRLHQRQDLNRLLDGRGALPVVPAGELLDARGDAGSAEPHLYRTVVASGRYVPEEEVYVRGRTLDGAPGAWVLTPLDLGDGTGIVVNRGWIPANDNRPVLPAGGEPAAGTVTVRGLLMPTQERGRIGARDPGEGRLGTLARADIERVDRQVGLDLLPAYVQLEAQDPAPAAPLPAALPPPERDEGPHRGYAGQWFIFAAMWTVGYPVLVRRSARRRLSDGGGRRGPIDDRDDLDAELSRLLGPPSADPGTGTGRPARSP